MRGLTRHGGGPHNDRTTSIDGNTAPRKHRGFFAPGFRQRGPLTHTAGTGECQFSRIGARSTWRNKGRTPSTNKLGRSIAVVEPLRLPFAGGASIEPRLGATAIMQYHIPPGGTRPTIPLPDLSRVAMRLGASRQLDEGGGGDGRP